MNELDDKKETYPRDKGEISQMIECGGHDVLKGTHSDEEEMYCIEDEKRVLRKTDMYVLPFLCLLFFFQYLDKQILSYSAIFGLTKDLKLTGQDYQWTASIFFFGQLFAEWPAIWLVHKLPLASFTGITCTVWGGVLMAAAGVQNFEGLAAQRFFLGVSEAVVSPAFVLLTSFWYRKEEHPLRTTIWISMNLVAQILGSLLTYGLGNTKTSLAPWRLLFLVCGGMTVIAGVLFVLFFPVKPENAWFLTENEKKVAIARLKKGITTQDKKGPIRWDQVKENLLDLKFWSILAISIGGTSASFVIAFQSILLYDLGFTNFQAILLGLPAPAIQLVALWSATVLVYVFNNRCLVGIGLFTLPLAGNIANLILPSENKYGKLVATWFANVLTPQMAVALSLIASNFLGQTKKTMVSFAYFIGYCIGLIISPQFFRSNQAPRYQLGLILDIAFISLGIAGFATHYICCKRANVLRDNKSVDDPTYEPGAMIGDLDVSDKRVPSFRYAL